MAVVKNQKNQEVRMYGARVKTNHPAFADIGALFKDMLTEEYKDVFSPAPSFFTIREKWMTTLRIIILGFLVTEINDR